ncbi:hypothetical protein AJ80_09608 [Polytolypa hystricis UAMH7299]|uniref:Non-reducing polyketide synthase nscA n=1 Tax=Polytolypa hystricis (strain UAMH7299) TaxID=1447883 RepID=A0A2B7WN01_POLH7|nr:hypothetical protein AJ80_09608 [Polytolypa hystricis UAMH7299]
MTVIPLAKAEGPTMASQLLLFGDLSLMHFEDHLRQLLHVKNNPLLTSFFDRANYALRRFLEALPLDQQDLFPHFTTLIDLHSRFGETEGTPVLGFFLLSVHEVAQSIMYFSENSRQFPPPANTYVIGSCTGGFAAAAVSWSQTLPDLVSNGVEAVLVAFRTALRSFLVGQSLSPRRQSTQPNKSWSAVLSVQGDSDLRELLKEYTSTKVTPFRDSALWISAVTPGRALTLSGRPSILQDFLATYAGKLKSRSLDIESPYHAAHMFDEADVEEIISHSFGENVSVVTQHISRTPFLSASTGSIVNASNYTDLLRTVVQETLLQPVRWDLVLASCRTILAGSQVEKCTILPFSSNATSMVSATLGKETAIQIVVEDVSSVGSSPDTGRFEHSKIAIVGYSGRFPSADSNEAFWELLKAGRDVHREVPADRFDWKAHYDPTGKKKNTSRVKYGCWIDEPGLFDTHFFNMSPREAENTDPAQRLAITTTYEAMEMAGMVRNRTPSTQQDRVGIFFGTTSDDWREVNSGQDVGTYFIPGGNRAFVPGRISYFFRFSGPSLSIDTACSSSFAAIQAACSYLWRGECDTAIAGGTNVLTNPDNFAGLDRGHFLSTTGNCNAFDDGASGYCRSDAVGTVILKRLEDAEADNDPILGVIVGTNTNHCGQTDSITRPHEGDQSSVFKRIIRHSGIDPLDVSYVEMHGTGTQAGDATEMNSVLSVFVPEYKRTTTQPARPLYIGSAKANIGHAESASGVSSLIKLLMMMKNSEIPLHCGIKTRINHNYPLDLAQRGINIAHETTPWLRENSNSGLRRAFLNNFSAAGGNTAILLEDAPMKTPRMITEPDLRPLHVVAVTAKSSKSLVSNVNSLISFLEKNASSVSLPALSYTTTARRMHHNYRVVITGSDTASILSTLKSRATDSQALANIKPIPAAARKKPRVVFMFSGQGTLYNKLGKSLFVTNAAFRTSIFQLNRLAQIQGFPSFLGLIDGSMSSTDVQAVSPVISQLALVCIQLAFSDLWKSWGVEPTAVIGHSLGEYAGLYAAGVLSVADVIYVVGTRASLLEKRCTPGTHSMLAVKGSMQAAEQLIRRISDAEGCELACANQPNGNVISGPGNKISEIASAATDMGIETVRLSVPFAFHSAQVEPILEEFEQAATQGVTYHPPAVPVLSPLLSKVVPAGDTDTLNASYLTAACRSQVNFTGALTAAATEKADDGGQGVGANERTIWLEIGAHPVCSGMVKGTLGSQSKTIATLNQHSEDYKILTTALEVMYLAGIEINWNEYHRHFPASHEVLALPMYKWDSKNYWIMYRNDFCLTKGDDVVPQIAIEAPEEPKPGLKYLSPCAQQIIEESHGADKSSMVVESDIFDERLLPVLQGHLVNGAALCPSSAYADLGLTLATYMLRESPNGLDTTTTGLEVNNVKAENPLIARPDETTHRFRASAKTEWSSGLISISIFSVNANGKRTTSHGKLEVRVTPQQRWADEWKRSTHLITSRISDLSRSENNECNLIKRGLAYKLFGALVEYGKEYQGMSEVLLNSANLEAVATVQLQVGGQGFHLNPRWIDSLCHIAGFIMNANDGIDSRTQVYINHGWERLRFAEPIQKDKTYNSYNRMQQVGKASYAGDTYILDGDRIVAIVEGVVFQGVPRRVLDNLLPSKAAAPISKLVAPANSAPRQNPAPKPKPAASLSAPAPQPTKAKPARDASSGVLGRILALICEEVGLQQSELKPESEFIELGVDSLLSLTILSKIRSELGLDFPASLFVDNETVGDLQTLIGGEEDDGAISTPSGSDASSDEESQETQLTSSATSVYQDAPQNETSSSSKTKATLLMRQIIAEETGVAIDELKPSTVLADIGIDSLLSLSIGGKIQEILGADMSMFMGFETLQDVEDALCNALGLNQSDPKKTNEYNPAAPKDMPVADTPPQSAATSSLPQATSILLSGSLKTAEQVLFLFPDGSGSASSYAAVARTINPNKVAVYGLNCPWRKTATEMTRLGITMSTMVARYIVEVRRLIQQVQQHRQTQGKFPASIPHISVGGWSAGGILAVEAIRQLQQNPEAIQIHQLILFDSPNPIGLQNPPQRMYDFFDSLGIFGGGKNKTPEWLLAHFDAFIRILDAYEPEPLCNPPSSLIVYARDGVCKDPNGPKMEIRPDDPREMIWLLNNRTDFSADGWASVLGREKLSVSVMDEVNHFSLMDPGPGMTRMGHVVAKFLSG